MASGFAVNQRTLCRNPYTSWVQGTSFQCSANFPQHLKKCSLVSDNIEKMCILVHILMTSPRPGQAVVSDGAQDPAGMGSPGQRRVSRLAMSVLS